MGHCACGGLPARFFALASSWLNSTDPITCRQVRPQRSGTGSGFVIEKRRIITNAHGEKRPQAETESHDAEAIVPRGSRA